jgi:hypothetical protein
MADVLLTHILGQYRGDQTLSALLAGHPVDGRIPNAVLAMVAFLAYSSEFFCFRVQNIQEVQQVDDGAIATCELQWKTCDNA